MQSHVHQNHQSYIKPNFTHEKRKAHYKFDPEEDRDHYVDPEEEMGGALDLKENKLFDKMISLIDDNNAHGLAKLINERLSHRALMKLKLAVYELDKHDHEQHKKHVYEFVDENFQCPELVMKVMSLNGHHSKPDISGSGFGHFLKKTFKKAKKAAKKVGKKLNKARKDLGHFVDPVTHSKLFQQYGKFVNLGSDVVGGLGAITGQPELGALAVVMKGEAAAIKASGK